MSKYIVEIKPEYEDSFKGLMILGAKDSNLFVDTLAVDDLEELNSDYINEHFGDLQDEAYKRGYEDGKWKAEDGCDGCKYYEDTSLTNPCSECSRGHVDHYKPVSDLDRIVVGDEVEWTGDKYIVTYINYNIDTSEITDYDLLGEDGSVADHVKKCSFVKTGRHFDIKGILEAMKA